jgi:hypothetical protein
MKYLILTLLIFSSFTINAQQFFQYDYPGKIYRGEKECNLAMERSHKQLLDYNSFYEMLDSTVKYINLFECSRKCKKYDSSYYYKGRTYYFLNQTEYYCAILYGADSVRSIIYYKPGEQIPKKYCRCEEPWD